MLSLIIAESSLELVPKKLWNHKSVLSHAKKLGKRPSEILLDNSWHYAAMKDMPNELKRGRPDIVHFNLLEACSIPLYFENRLKVFVHTLDDKVISIGNNIRLPKSYHRFVGLIEKLYEEKIVKSEGNILLELQDLSFSQLIKEIKPKKVIGLSSKGTPTSFEAVAKNLREDYSLVVGGFQRGGFTKTTLDKFDSLYSVMEDPLESHIVTSRILYEYEKAIFM
ncbi:MAG: ribosome biogenesis protein [Nitrosopumilaceae archaeon]|nr:ribosome biogenesis protein [Nitrosopumilaceae archaeon]NIT99917.1 ribosome biogenesis protein [Nitrosopumilaceae archaeon]NIU86270.1 ribosome biogenesis protein [Nitrosopumilaceae archaeon]NIV65025.1 ribosome biogenesis protein [Nitrosopumilaceae archaeon]NIX60520.1 ribosome biogenesis protein [Nitrosopumilaceae archaeon]